MYFLEGIDKNMEKTLAFNNEDIKNSTNYSNLEDTFKDILLVLVV